MGFSDVGSLPSEKELRLDSKGIESGLVLARCCMQSHMQTDEREGRTVAYAIFIKGQAR